MRYTRADVAAVLFKGARNDDLVKSVKTSAKLGASKARAEVYTDDIEQDIWLFLRDKADTLDEGRNIEPWLIEVARLTGMTYRRKYAMFGTEGEDTRADEAAVPESDTAAEPGGYVDEIDREAALASLAQSSAWLRKEIRDRTAAMQSQASTKRTGHADDTAKRVPNKDQKRLRALRMKLGLTQGGMALRLGLKLPTYQAYEYGRTKAVPPQAMKAAEALASDPSYSYVKETYQGRTMAQIAKGWAKEMGVDPNSPAELASALGINKSSTSRWLRRQTSARLQPEELLIYEDRVRRQKKYHAQMKQQRAKAK